MRWSIKIARIAGIEVRIHITFLLFLAWIGFGEMMLVHSLRPHHGRPTWRSAGAI